MGDNSNTVQTDDKIGWGIPALIVVIVFLFWAGSWLFLYDKSDRGTFGDMFGAVNALFSGLAFAGVIYAILLQRQELKLQRYELEQNRKELKGQKLQLEAQNQTLRKQTFENTFFQLLRLQNEIVDAIDLVNPNDRTQVTKGRDCFRVFYDRFKKYGYDDFDQKTGPEADEEINKTYLYFNQKHQDQIGHYFRSLYNIVKFVDNSDTDDKRLYTNLVRAQLSSYELVLLFYNCLSDVGREKFKPLIEKYALLKTLPINFLISSSHTQFYKYSAFGNDS